MIDLDRFGWQMRSSGSSTSRSNGAPERAARATMVDDRKGVEAVTSVPDRPEPAPADDEPTFDELASRQGVQPVETLAELAQPELWESDEEYAAFLTDLYAARRAGTA